MLWFVLQRKSGRGSKAVRDYQSGDWRNEWSGCSRREKGGWQEIPAELESNPSTQEPRAENFGGSRLFRGQVSRRRSANFICPIREKQQGVNSMKSQNTVKLHFI